MKNFATKKLLLSIYGVHGVINNRIGLEADGSPIIPVMNYVDVFKIHRVLKNLETGIGETVLKTKNMNRLENNRLIAEFMELPFFFGEPYNNDIQEWELEFDTLYKTEDLPYSSDWNYLMEVIEKIEKMGYWVDYITGDCFIYDDDAKLVIPNPMHEDGDTKLTIYYKIVAEFIKWFNTKK